MRRNVTKKVINIGLPADLLAGLSAASEQGPYRLSRTAIIERGIQLALAELDGLRSAKIA